MQIWECSPFPSPMHLFIYLHQYLPSISLSSHFILWNFLLLLILHICWTALETPLITIYLYHFHFRIFILFPAIHLSFFSFLKKECHLQIHNGVHQICLSTVLPMLSQDPKDTWHGFLSLTFPRHTIEGPLILSSSRATDSLITTEMRPQLSPPYDCPGILQVSSSMFAAFKYSLSCCCRWVYVPLP